MIENFREEYYFLSNFYNSKVKIYGIVYLNNEAAFQSMKCKNKEQRKEFAMLSPSEAKRKGRHIDLRTDWEQVKYDIMKDIAYAKFTQNSKLGERLIKTGTEQLVEGNTWHDNTWGNCICPKCSSVLGTNYLGKILMDVREQLIKDKNGIYDR